MSDRHIRRSGSDYGDAFLALLPMGQAWPKWPGSTLDLACRGLVDYWGFVDSRAADLLEIESDPRRTVELLQDWERNWGLPDPCYPAPTTIPERQAALVRRMTILGGQSREWFIDLAASIGYTITISEFRVFVVGLDRCGDNRVYGDGSAPMYDEWNRPILNDRGVPVVYGELSDWPYYGLGPPRNRFFWTVHLDSAILIWFRCYWIDAYLNREVGQCGIDPFLRIIFAEDLQCLLNRWKPAHTEIIFDYSAGSVPSPDWVPDTATIYIDFVGAPQGRAWVEGVGEVPVNTLLGSDPNTSGWDTTLYDETYVTPDGYSHPLSPFAFIGYAIEKIRHGSTVVVQYKQQINIATPFVFISPDGNDALVIEVNTVSWNGVEAETWANSNRYRIYDAVNTGPDILNKVAFTVTGTRLEVAINGWDACGKKIIKRVLDASDLTPGNPVIAALMDFTDDSFMDESTNAPFVQYITIYDPLPTIAGLAELSALPEPPVPAWVPANALVHVDLAAGTTAPRATLDAAPLNVTISGGGLIATRANASAVAGAKSASVIMHGLYYFEVTWTNVTGNKSFCGVLKSDGTYDGALNGFLSTIIRKSGEIVTNNALSGKTLGPIPNGGVVGVAINLTMNSAWFRLGAGSWNGDPAANPATGTGWVQINFNSWGPFSPIVGFGGAGTAAGESMTVNFGPTFANPPPTGFTAWPGGVPATRAWVKGHGEVPADWLVGHDDNADNGWGPTGYNPVYLTLDGYVYDYPLGPPALVGEACCKIISGATIKYGYKYTYPYGTSHDFEIMSADGNDGLEVEGSDDELSLSSWSGDREDTEANVLLDGLGAPNAVAVTVAGRRFEAAANKDYGSLIALTLLDADRPPNNPMAAVVIDMTQNRLALQYVTIYEPLPSTAGLVELSDNGALASSIVLTGSATVAEDTHPGTLAGALSVLNSFANVEDMVFSLTDDAGGKFGVIRGNNLAVITVLGFATAGTYNVTVAVTGALPAAPPKTFTITVTDTAVPPPPTLAVLDGFAFATALTSNHRVVTHTNEPIHAGEEAGVRSATVKKAGKWFFSVIVRQTSAFDENIGIIWDNQQTYYNNFANATYIQLWTGNIISNVANSGKSLGQVLSGHVIDVAVDLTLGKGWFRKNGGLWNGDAAADPATNVGGVTIFGANTLLFAPFISFDGAGNDNYDWMEANFGESAYLYPAPSGFANWPVSVPPVPVVLDSTTVAAVTLSGGNLVAQNTGTTSANQGARVADTYVKPFGKWYFEVTLTALTGGANRGIAIFSTPSTYTSFSGVVLYVTTGQIWAAGSNSGKTLGPRSSGNVIGIAYDADHDLIWYRNSPSGSWNGDLSANPGTNVGGIPIPSNLGVPFFLFGGTGGTANNIFTANFGASAFVGAVPAGFTGGWISQTG